MLFLLYGLCLSAQTNNYRPELPQIPFLTPEAASLGKYGEIPVSEYTGVPQIGIPIHTVKIGGLELPLSLTYHASGIKVAQEATWVGLGWDLQAGGCINRIVSGSYDKEYTVNTPWSTWQRFFGQQSTPFCTLGDNSRWGGVEENPNSLCYPMSLYQDLLFGMGEPDIFQANFCGHSFSFILHPESGLPVMVGEEQPGYKIEALNAYSNSWKITDDQGVQYFFEEEGTEIANTRNQSYIASWFLTKMVHPQKGVITLNYETEGNLWMTLQPALYQEYVEAEFEKTLKQLGSVSAGGPSGELLGLQNKWMYENSTITKKYLKSITTALEQVDFHKSSREDIKGYSRKLDSLVVTNYRNQTVKRVVFNYTYQTGVNTGGDHIGTTVDAYRYKRLMLSGMTMNGQVYSFGYNATTLPYKTSYATDFWGYYNGRQNLSFLCTANLKELSANPAAYTLGDANRYVDPDKVKAGMLEKIVWPTKGYTVMEYESNRFTDDETICPTAAQANATCNATWIRALDYQPSKADKTKSFTLQRETKVTVQFAVNSPYYYYADLASASAVLSRMDAPGIHKTYRIPAEQLGERKHAYSFEEELTLPAGVYMITASFPSDKYNPTTSQDYASTTHLAISYHEYNFPTSYTGESYGGGVRIASISQYESDGTLLGKQSYDYTQEDGTTSGRLLLPVPKIQKDTLYIGMVRYSSNAGTINPILSQCSLEQWKKYTLSSSVKMPAVTFLSGTPIGYSRVTVKESGNGIENGSTVLSFFNTPATHYCHDTYLFADNLNGKMRKREVINSAGRKVQETEWNYLTGDSSLLMLNAFASDLAPGIPDSFEFIGLKRYRIQAYPFFRIWTRLAGERTTDYIVQDGHRNVVNAVRYEYNEQNHRPSVVIRNTSVSADTLRTLLRYADAFPGTAAYAAMTTANMIGIPIETIEQRNGTNIARSRTNYALFNGKPLPSGLFWAKGNDAYISRISYTRYDSNGNLLELKRADGVTISYLWSYKNQYPVAEIEGMAYDEVVTALGATYVASINNGVEGINQLASLRNLLPAALVTARSYLPVVGVSGMAQPNGDLLHYVYDAQGRLSQVTDINRRLIEQYNYNYK